MQPLASILIPAHNAARWLPATIDSALRQSWPRKEIIIVENGSTDDTLQVARRGESRMVRVLTIPLANASTARNRAFAESQGDLIQYLDADDLLSPNKLEAQVAQVSASECVLSMSARSEFFDGEDPEKAEIQRGWPFIPSQDTTTWLADLLGVRGEGGFVALHQWLTPRALITAAGPWDETLTVNDDGEFFSRVVLAATELRTALDAVAYYRRHRSSGSLSAGYRFDRSHLASMLRATDLIGARLLAKRSDTALRVALSRHYYECAVFAYPIDRELGNRAEARALQLHPSARPPAPTSAPAALVRGLFGWRFERQLAAKLRTLRQPNR